MKKMGSPCYGCPDREIGCHTDCEKYKLFINTNREVDRLTREAKSKVFKSYSRSVESRPSKIKEV